MSYSADLLGTVRTLSTCNICGPANQSKNYCANYGPEWSWNSAGTCSECKYNCLGSVCTPGSYSRCAKTQYTGNINQCCLGQQPDGYPIRTCNPLNTPTSPVCSSIVQSYCSSGDKIFTDPICQSWASASQNA